MTVRQRRYRGPGRTRAGECVEAPEEVSDAAQDTLDPHMGRMIAKLATR
jgi:hypothetical protein